MQNRQSKHKGLEGRLEIVLVTGMRRKNCPYKHKGLIISNEKEKCLIKNVSNDDRKIIVRVQKQIDSDDKWELGKARYLTTFISPLEGSGLEKCNNFPQGLPSHKYLLYGIWEKYMIKRDNIPSHDEVKRYFDPGHLYSFFWIPDSSTEKGDYYENYLIISQSVHEFNRPIRRIIDFDVSGSIERNIKKRQKKRIGKYKTPKVIIVEDDNREGEQEENELTRLLIQEAEKEGIVPIRMRPLEIKTKFSVRDSPYFPQSYEPTYLEDLELKV